MTGKRIFLSYAHDPYARLAERLKNDLAAQGNQVWFDASEIRVGQDWELRLEQGLDEVKLAGEDGLFMLLMTPKTVDRPNGYCLNEITGAVYRGLRILPVMVADCAVPLSICRIQFWTSGRLWSRLRWGRLTAAFVKSAIG